MTAAVCIGGASVDRKYVPADRPRLRTSNPASARRSFGGVARNVAENLSRLQVPVSLLCVLGNDENGDALLRHAEASGIETGLIARTAESPTSEYAAVLDERGDLYIGVSDMSAAASITPALLEDRWPALERAGWLFADCNLSGEALQYCIAHCGKTGPRLAIDVVSEAKVRRLPADLRGISLLIMNHGEAQSYLGGDAPIAACADALRKRGAATAVVTRGARGIVLADAQGIVELPAQPADCVDATGAGDALAAGMLYASIRGRDAREAARTGMLCAALTVASPSSVRPDLSPALLESAWTAS